MLAKILKFDCEPTWNLDFQIEVELHQLFTHVRSWQVTNRWTFCTLGRFGTFWKISLKANGIYTGKTWIAVFARSFALYVFCCFR